MNSPMRRYLAIGITILLLTGACSSGGETADTSQTATTLQPPPTTSQPVNTTSVTAAPEPATPVDELLGAGDSRYPELGNGGYDVDHYTVDLTFDPEPNTINALVTIDATATMPIQQFSLDFTGFEITSVEVDGHQATFERTGGELIVDAGSVIPTGEGFTVTVTYEGTPEPVLSQALPFYIGWLTDHNGTSYVVSEPDGAHTWMPVNDHPSDKATYTFKITVPDPLVAAANGTHVETITDLGWSTWVWEMDYPMASYLATVVIGNLDHCRRHRLERIERCQRAQRAPRRSLPELT